MMLTFLCDLGRPSGECGGGRRTPQLILLVECIFGDSDLTFSLKLFDVNCDNKF